MKPATSPMLQRYQKYSLNKRKLPMNRSFYSLGIFFSGLSIASGLLQSILYILLGAQLFYLDSFLPWFVILAIINLVWSLIILKYYHYKKYWFTFLAITFVTIATLYQHTVFYIILVSGKLKSYYIPALLLVLSIGILYAISLIFSRAGKRPWLKTAGIFTFILALVLISAIIWHMNSQDVQLKSTLDNFMQWASLTGNLIAVVFMMNFLSELRILKEENVDSTQHKSLESFLGLASTIALLATLIFGVWIARESYSALYWGKRNAERAQALVRLFENRTFVNSKGDTLLYLLLKPLDYDPKKKYPLVVSLPYGGYEASAAQLLSNDTNRRKYPAFLFVPHCPPGSGWGSILNYPAIDALVYEAIHALDKEPGVDVKRRYVTGVSRGGYGSWHFIGTSPEMFAAAIPVCGGGEPTLAPNMVSVSVWAFHGEKDRNVPVKGSRDMIEAIKKAGGNPRYTEFPGAGHNIWEQVIKTPDLLDWLFAQKRD